MGDTTMILAIDTGLDSHLYRAMLLLHILTAIVGLGGVLLNGAYAMQAQRRPGPTGRAVSESNYAVSMIAEKFIYAIPVFGLLLVWTSGGAWSLGDTWIWLSLVVFAIAIGISHAGLIPGHRKINSLLAEMDTAGPPTGGPPPQLAELRELGKRMGATAAVLDLALIVLLVLMIWKPGA